MTVRICTMLAVVLIFSAIFFSVRPACCATEQGILIEMEEFDGREPDDGSFARPTLEMAGSKRRVLFRFFKPGVAYYTFELDRPAEYTAWIRYGSKHDQKLRVAVDPKDEPQFQRADLPATGGYIGYGVWGWAQIFKKHLDAGKHEIAIGNVPLRPDCIYITSTDKKPTDDLIMTDPTEELDEETLKLASGPLEGVHPDWIEELAPHKLPEWYDGCRVQLHTRLSPHWMDKPIFLSAAEAFSSMGVRAFVRHIKSGSEGAWWASSVGAVHPKAEDRNLARQIINDAHDAGCRIIVYHRHMEDRYLAEKHPNWACRNHEGEMIDRRGPMVCFNSPYDDFVLKRLLELVDMGADGLYFDEVHMPKSGCWCEFCKRKFKKETGLDHPEFPDPKNPVWQRLIDFNNMTIERVFRKWRKAIQEHNADCMLLIGSNKWPTMASRTMNQRLFRIADAMKTEITLPRRMGRAHIPPGREMAAFDPEIKVALGYTLARDSCYGHPPHIWAHGILDSTSMLYAAAGMMTHGCVANLDIRENTIPDMMFKPAYQLGEKVSPYFEDAKPLGWVLIHYPEYARDKIARHPDRAWREILYPTYGAYRAFYEAGVPAGIITDSYLAEAIPDDCRILFLPAPDALTDGQQQSVKEFENAGGIVIRDKDNWNWHDADEQDAAQRAFMNALGDEVDRAPVQVFGGPESMHADAFATPNRGRIVVPMSNKFQWVHTGRRPDKDKIDELTTPPPNCTGVELELRTTEPPQRVFDAVTGKRLQLEKAGRGVRVTVPEFEYMAMVVAEFE